MGNTQALSKLRRAAFRLATWQLALTAVIAGAAGWYGGRAGAAAALAGGGIGIVAGLYQALRMFSVDAATQEAKFLRAVYVGQAMKLVLTSALFIVAIRVFGRNFGPLIVAYAATFVVYWLALGTGFPWVAMGPEQKPGGPPADRSDS